MNEGERKAKFFALVERYNQLGCLLDEDLDTRDAAAVAEARLILAEMKKTQAAIDGLLAQYRSHDA